jgi:hypothetical protein
MTDRIHQAIDRLAGVLHELGYTDRISIKPAVRMLLAPGEPTAQDGKHMHAIGLTTDLVELLADAVERLIATRTNPDDRISADVFALAKPDLAAAIDDAFAGIDLTELTRTVLADTAPHDRMTVTRALDDMFGDVTHPEAEEDE